MTERHRGKANRNPRTQQWKVDRVPIAVSFTDTRGPTPATMAVDVRPAAGDRSLLNHRIARAVQEHIVNPIAARMGLPPPTIEFDEEENVPK